MEMNYVYVAAGIVLAVLLIILFVNSYVKAPPSNAFIISGLNKEPRVLIGKGGIRIPFFERLDKVYLGQITVDIKTEQPVPTTDFINVNVDAVAKIAVTPTPEGIRLAGKNFLNMQPTQIAAQLQDSLQGNMREIIGTLDLKSLNTDRDGFSDQVLKKATPDMEKLGITILSCNIQNVTDEQGLIENMGADNTWKIKKDAANAKAIAQKEIAVVEAENAKLANDARVEADTQIAVRQNDLAIKKADLKQQADTRMAIADAAYEIQKQEQQKTINERAVEAEIARTRKEQDLTSEKIKVQQNQLEAEINKQADADKYKAQTNSEAAKYVVEQQASAELERRKREAEAKKYEAEQEALAIRAKAEAQKYSMTQEAEGIKAKGEAEAYAIQKKGEAEALAMEKKAEAFKKYNDAAVTQMIIEQLPGITANVASQVSAIDSVNIYGSDASGVSKLTSTAPTVIKQTLDLIKSTTGYDLAKKQESDEKK